MSKPLRLLYAAGPGNIIATYSHWINGRDDPSQVAIAYSSQFYELCRTLDAQGYAISSFGEKKLLLDGQFRIEHRPNPLRTASGLLYHLGQLRYGLGLLVSAIRSRADVAVIADGTTHWFVLSLLDRLGVRVIPSLHCALWRKYATQRTLEKFILKLDCNFFATGCSAILAASEDIAEQVEALTRGHHQPILKFLPVYRRTEFADVAEPDEKRSPFRVFFAGRIEPDKGVFDLLEIARGLAAAGRQDIRFDLCGEGSALEPLRLAATQAGLDSSFACHGYCNKPKMRQMFQQAHAVIVPTRTEFVEGFNQVVAEGVLSGRPAVTSAVCPALSYVRDAAVEVPPNDIKGYTDALIELCDNRDFYEEKRRSCLGVREQFYDFSRSWGAALKSVLVGMHQAGELGGTLRGNS